MMFSTYGSLPPAPSDREMERGCDGCEMQDAEIARLRAEVEKMMEMVTRLEAARAAAADLLEPRDAGRCVPACPPKGKGMISVWSAGDDFLAAGLGVLGRGAVGPWRFW